MISWATEYRRRSLWIDSQRTGVKAILPKIGEKPLPLELLVEETHQMSGLRILGHVLLHQLAGVDDGPVILAAEGVPDLDQGRGGHLAGEVHGDLAGLGDAGLTALAGHVGQSDVEVLGYLLLDLVDGDGFAGLFLKDVAEEVLQGIVGQGLTAE